MPKIIAYTYTVVGQGQFPTDMLRYDRAYPVDDTNAGIAPYSHSPTGYGNRSVNLRSENAPTVDRWISFGWHVENIQKRSW